MNEFHLFRPSVERDPSVEDRMSVCQLSGCGCVLMSFEGCIVIEVFVEDVEEAIAPKRSGEQRRRAL